MTEYWDMYDRDGKNTGKKVIRGDRLLDGEFHIVVHIWIKFENQFLIQKRASHLDWKPGLWATTGGSALSGEDPLTAAVRETTEELGINFPRNRFEIIRKEFSGNDYTHIFLVNVDNKPDHLAPDKNEVQDTIWAEESKIKSMIEQKKFIDYGNSYFNLLFSIK